MQLWQDTHSKLPGSRSQDRPMSIHEPGEAGQRVLLSEDIGMGWREVQEVNTRPRHSCKASWQNARRHRTDDRSTTTSTSWQRRKGRNRSNTLLPLRAPGRMFLLSTTSYCILDSREPAGSRRGTGQAASPHRPQVSHRNLNL